MFKRKFLISLIITTLFISGIVYFNTFTVSSATNQFKGVNWADQRDNFVSGNLYPSGLSSSDNYDSAAIVADRIVGQFVSKLGTNTVRMPINETTVNGSYWNVYTGAIDKALTYGKVILCYWSHTRGVPTSMNDWWNMWSKVVNKYGSNSNCYFEPFNEPNMYSNTDLCNLYNEFVNVRFTSIPKGRFILDGAGLAQNVPAVGGDSRLSNCLLAVHDYSFFAYLNSESAWQDHIKSYVGNYASRTVCTEWGYPNSPGSKNGVNYGYIDYLDTSGTGGGDYFYYYARGLSKQFRAWGMGSCFWPGLRDADWYSMTVKSGSGSSINLSIPNTSGLYWLQYAWGDDGTPTATPGEISAFTQIEAENYTTQSGVQTETCSEGGENVGYIENGDYVHFSNVNFGTSTGSFEARVASGADGGNIEIRLDSVNGTLIGSCTVSGTGDWQSWTTVTTNVNNVSGNHDLYLVFTGGSDYLMNINWFRFNTSSTVTPTPETICGDVNSSGTTDITDALLISQHYVGENPVNFNPGVADVNRDGNIDIQDALLVAQYYIGIVDTLSCN